MPIKVVINKDDNRSDIDIFFTKIFNLRLDFDEFLKRFFFLRDNSNKITLQNLLYNIKLYKVSKNIVTTTTRMITVKKLTFIIKTKSTSLEMETWSFVFSWTFFGYFQNYIHSLFKGVNNEYYNHQISLNNTINFECHFNIRILYLLFSSIRNIRDIPKVIKFIRKGSKGYGTSNI